MSDVTKLSPANFDALYAELRDEMVAASDELVSAGLGAVPGEEIRKLAANGDPLAIRYIEVQDAFQEAAYERSARFHASARSAGRQVADPSSVTTGRRKKMAQHPLTAPIILPNPKTLQPS